MIRARPSPTELSQLDALYRAGRYADLQRLASRLLKQHPGDATLWKALGVAQMAAGNDAQALPAMERAAQLLPRDAQAQGNYAQALASAGRLADAQGAFRKALALDPRLANAWSGLGHLLGRQGRHDEALDCLSRAAALQTGSPVIHNRLGNVLRDMGRLADARASYERALALQPRFPEALNNLGMTLAQLGLEQLGEARLREAIALQPQRAIYHSNLANLLKDAGRFEESREEYVAAIELDPSFAAARNNLLVALNLADVTPAQARLEAARFGEWAASRVATPLPPAQPVSASGPLRVGMVSGDFRNHPVGYFLEGLLRQIDPSVIQLSAYATVAATDDLTERIKPRFARWQCIAGMDDASAARMMRSDAVDVLIDLAGHTAHNRLTLFAWRPAPVQASWLGYFATTGMPAVDWVIADRTSVPASHEAHFVERIWLLPDTRLCFEPPADAPPVASAPALSRGYVTFANFQHPGKINDRVLAAWSQVLQAVPSARLWLQNRALAEPEGRAHFQRRLAGAGIDLQRVILRGPTSRGEYLQVHAEVDIALDTFPYPGGTTTCEALWMGVPTVTLAGDRMLSRQGASIMAAAGLGDWVAADVADYVRIAAARAADVEVLATLRAGLRRSLVTTPLFDSARFAADFTQALLGMAGRRAGSAQEPATQP